MDIPVLRYLDVLIGLAVVMLLGATVVMAVTQLYVNSTYVRSRCLRDGLAELIHMLNPQALGPHSTYVAERLLRYPLAGRPNTSFGNLTGQLRNWYRDLIGKTPLPRVNPADVVEREEFCLMMLEWAAGEGALGAQDRALATTAAERARIAEVRAAIEQTVREGGFGDPGAVLRMVRARTVENERAAPGKRAVEWRSAALMDVAAGDLTARVFTWYDNCMQRVIDRFALHARVVGSMIALVLAFALQLDTIALVRTLSQNEEFRNNLVSKSEAALKAYEQTAIKAGAKPDEETLQKTHKEAQAIIGELRALKGPVQPLQSPSGWAWASIPGILVSWVLLSLGAPFWYDLLKKLMGLRSIIAQKEEQDRNARVQEQKDATSTIPALPPPVESLSAEPDVVEIRSAANVRSGKPSQQSPIVTTLEPETLITVKGAVRGQAVANANGQTIDKWFVTVDDDYVWAGVTDKP